MYNLLLCNVLVMPEGSVCEIENQNGVVTLKPLPHTACTVNDREVTEPCRLAQGKCKTQVLVYTHFGLVVIKSDWHLQCQWQLSC